MPAPYEKHRAQLKAILLAWGMPQDNAEVTADILGWADLHGVDSHGISMLPGYDRLRRSGRAKMAARPRILKETPVSALVDGDGGLGHVRARFAMQVAIDKAATGSARNIKPMREGARSKAAGSNANAYASSQQRHMPSQRKPILWPQALARKC
jgi:hypothetical protein